MSIMHNFAPILGTKNPQNRFPQMAPKDNTEPIHDISSTVNSPDSNGLFCERSNGNAGDNHPTPAPRVMIRNITINFQSF